MTLEEQIAKAYGAPLTPVTLDYESYFGLSRHKDIDKRSCSLSKLSYSEYIAHPSWKVMLLTIKVGDQPTRAFHEHQDILDALSTVDWEHALLIGHNLMFDALVTTMLGFPIHHSFCTLGASRAMIPGIPHDLDTVSRALRVGGPYKSDLKHALVNARNKYFDEMTTEEQQAYIAYGINDTDLTRRVFDKLFPHMVDMEKQLLSHTVRIHANPVLEIDYDMLEEARQEDDEKTQQLLAACGVDRATLRSDAKFAELLRSRGVKPPVKWSEKKQAETWAFSKDDNEFIELWAKPELVPILDAKQAVNSSLVETRCARMKGIADAHGGKMPASYNYAAAHTLRWGGTNKSNLQNLVRKSKLRLSIRAPKGFVLLVCDSAQIEARTLTWEAQFRAKLERFARNEDLYSLFASKIFGRPVDRKREEVDPNTGKIFNPDYVEGHVGKCCLAADTLVLTQEGWIPIKSITKNHKLWDGTEWVNHQGLIYQGQKTTITHNSVEATPDHEILTAHGWREWHEVHTSPSLFQSALSSANLPPLPGNTNTLPPAAKTADTNLSCAAPAAGKAWSTVKTSLQAALHAVINVPGSKPALNDSGNTKTPWPMMSTAPACSTAYPPASPDALNPTTPAIKTMAAAVYGYTKNGKMTGRRFSDTSKLSPAGTNRFWNWIVSTPMATMNPAISESSIAKPTPPTVDSSIPFNSESLIWKQNVPVYDLLSSGPKNRFTIWSSKGPLIVHNCELGLGYGMGWARFKGGMALGMMGGPRLFFEEDQAKNIIYTWRDENQPITAYWKTMEQVLGHMCKKHVSPLEIGPLTFGHECVILPNGAELTYPQLRWDSELANYVYMGSNGKTKIYGGLFVENITQAVARMVLAEQLLIIDKELPVVLHTHDELVSLVPERDAADAKKYILEIMSTTPTWAPGLPLFAEAGYDYCYSK